MAEVATFIFSMLLIVMFSISLILYAVVGIIFLIWRIAEFLFD